MKKELLWLNMCSRMLGMILVHNIMSCHLYTWVWAYNQYGSIQHSTMWLAGSTFHNVARHSFPLLHAIVWLHSPPTPPSPTHHSVAAWRLNWEPGEFCAMAIWHSSIWSGSNPMDNSCAYRASCMMATPVLSLVGSPDCLQSSKFKKTIVNKPTVG